MNLDIRYRTEFVYEKAVHDSHNELRACPADTETQQVTAYDVEISPNGVIQSFRDYWGTRVDVFGIEQRHRRLVIEARSIVATSPRSAEPPGDAPALAETRRELALSHSELLRPTTHTTIGAKVVSAASAAVDAAAASSVEAALALQELVRERIDYEVDSTEIGVELDEVWEQKLGVCQDFSHLLVGMCRSIGVPARYVSGYLYTDAEHLGHVADGAVEVQTHAWVEVAVDAERWFPLDPTNGRAVGEQHVKIGHGRDDDDVAPLHGAFFGPGSHELDATVEIRRSGGVTSAADRGLLGRSFGQ